MVFGWTNHTGWLKSGFDWISMSGRRRYIIRNVGLIFDVWCSTNEYDFFFFFFDGLVMILVFGYMKLSKIFGYRWIFELLLTGTLLKEVISPY